MSLRYKALISVIVLTGLLTVSLVWRAGTLFEQRERERITRELQRDSELLEEALGWRADKAAGVLKSETENQEIVEGVSRDLSASDDFGYFNKRILDRADADASVTLLENFLLEEGGRTVDNKLGELGLLAIDHNDATQAIPPTDKSLAAMLNAYFASAQKLSDTNESPSPIPPQTSVTVIDGRVWLVVVASLYESLQDYYVIGVAATMTELDSDWLRENLNTEIDANPVEKIVSNGQRATGSTLDEATTSAVMANHSDGSFDCEIDDEILIGQRSAFDLAPPDSNAALVTVKALGPELAPMIALQQQVAWAGAIIAIIAALVAWLVAMRAIRKLDRLTVATRKVREGSFDTRIVVRGGDEISRLSQAFNDMTTGLKALGMYTHDTVARSLLDNPELLGNTGTREHGTLFFSDVAGFTTITENMAASDVTEQLNEYFGALGRVLRDQEGYVDKFIGDSVMAYWGKPFVKTDDHAQRAVQAALACIDVTEQLRTEWRQQGKPEFFQRIGLASGPAVVGNIGTETKKNFTIIGDTVNLASRLEGANKIYGTEVLVDEATRNATEGIAYRELDLLRVVGRNEPVRVFEPLTERMGKHDDYERALALFRERKFEDAVAILGGIDDDPPSKRLLALCKSLIANPADDEWSPITDATSK